MDLGRLIDTHRGARSYGELARDCGGSPSSKRLQQLVTQPIKNFPDPDTIRALGRGLRLSHEAIVVAAAESLGLDTSRGEPRVVELMPARARDLTEEQAGAIAHLVHTIVETTTERGDEGDRGTPAIDIAWPDVTLKLPDGRWVSVEVKRVPGTATLSGALSQLATYQQNWSEAFGWKAEVATETVAVGEHMTLDEFNESAEKYFRLHEDVAAYPSTE